MILLKKIIKLTLYCSFFGLSCIVFLYFYVKSDLPSVQVLRDVQLQTPMQVFTKDGKLINQFGEKKRIPVTINDIPLPLLKAFLATEDNRFYEHKSESYRIPSHVVSQNFSIGAFGIEFNFRKSISRT